MANLPCQFDWIWNQQKFKLLGIPVKGFLRSSEEERHPLLYLSSTFWWQPTWKVMGEENLAFCLLVLTLSGTFTHPDLKHSFTNSRISFSEIPTQIEVRQFSRNALNLQSQTGCWDIHSYKLNSYWGLSPSSETVTAGPLRPYFVSQYTNLFLIFNQFCSFTEVWQIHLKLLSRKILVLGWYLKEIRAT